MEYGSKLKLKASLAEGMAMLCIDIVKYVCTELKLIINWVINTHTAAYNGALMVGTLGLMYLGNLNQEKCSISDVFPAFYLFQYHLLKESVCF